MEKLTLVFEEAASGGMNVRCKVAEAEKTDERLLVPRRQPTDFTIDGDTLNLKLKQGNIFVILDKSAAPLIFFVWNSSPYKTSETEVVALYKWHSVPMPFSIDFDGERPCLNQKEWMII